MTGAAEGIHISANFNEQYSCTHEVDARQSLQQCQRIVFILKFIQKPGIETGDTCFDLLDMWHQFVEHKMVACCQITLQDAEDFLTAGLEPSTGEFEYLMRWLSGDNRLTTTRAN
jgi:hypothetical protein